MTAVMGYNCAGKNFGFSSAIEKDGSAMRRGTVEIRRYGKGAGLQGFFLGSCARFGQLRDGYFENDPPTQHVTGSWKTEETMLGALGVMAGSQMLVFRRLTLEGFGGLQVQKAFSDLKSDNQFVEAVTAGVAVRAGVTVGLAVD